jgi:hypothetical protein
VLLHCLCTRVLAYTVCCCVFTSVRFIVLCNYYCIVFASSSLSVLGCLRILCVVCVITSIRYIVLCLRFILLCTYYCIVYVLLYCVRIIEFFYFLLYSVVVIV